MVCKEIKDEILEAALAGAAPGKTAAEHMTHCVECQNEYESLRSTMNVLDTWTTPEPSPYFDVRLRARLREAKEQEQHGRAANWLEKLGLRHLSWKPVAAGAFAMVLAVGGGLYSSGVFNSGTSTVHATAQACPVVDLQALDKNQQVLNELQQLEDGVNNSNASDAPQQVSE